MKKRNYFVNIVSDDPRSTTREFKISYKKVRSWVIASSVLLGLFGFFLYAFLTTSLDKEKMKRLERENIKKEKIIGELTTSIQSLDERLELMKDFKERILVAAGLKSPFALKEVGKGGPETEGPIENVSNTIESPAKKSVAQTKNKTYKNIVSTAKRMSQESKEVEKALKYVKSHIDEQKAELAAMPSLWPTRGYLTDAFGWRINPVTGKRQFHTGQDIATQLGNKVIATADGFVLITEHTPVMGKLIHIDHGHGFATRYGHLASYNVKEGDRVKRGQVIGYVGSTGRSTAPHLHYEVIYMGKNVNPMHYIID
jgi:murein DD-endopeptidase MepM/ murein hydrolase activator NlpD